MTLSADERELSRTIEVMRVPPGGRSFAIVASPSEREALARRLRVESIGKLEARGRVAWLPGGQILEVDGRIEARVTQLCVVTLEPFEQTLAFSFTRRFTPLKEPQTGEVVIDVERDEPEPLEGTVLDLGEIVAEELALALDPYPRGPMADAAMRAWEETARDEPAATSESATIASGRH
ncbi:MAG: DUF177 domain-containing protein [Geminicoccaceae bacterium]|nr:DUF177 domain-containing protein [Geminicoccaceae bacterium]MCS7266868.1 DUF177 domain-containing protein [Geminicoccaceae bacterium]MCX7628868.1 DUF177 domain-containing protein [Geminicoccaceae bacterium]MDW8124209.1 DUF177 domain-containing protein [Geminicoccaceae bacterium]MDW8340568.1 DUF177 domain-containing protein [Geminicoccaceae bacterium]